MADTQYKVQETLPDTDVHAVCCGNLSKCMERIRNFLWI